MPGEEGLEMVKAIGLSGKLYELMDCKAPVEPRRVFELAGVGFEMQLPQFEYQETYA